MRQKKSKIYLVGHNSLLNQSVQYMIENELRKADTGVELFTTLQEVAWRPASERTLLLVDDADPTAKSDLMEFLRQVESNDTVMLASALFNVNPESHDVCDAVRHGIRGLFFSSDPIDRLISGLQALLGGDVWIPKHVLINAAMERRRDPEVAVLESHLTMREIQILSLVCTGATNDQIAQELCISPHTVKTHMYNIFPKIGVENRLHAALWATKNLGDHFEHTIGGGAALAVAHR